MMRCAFTTPFHPYLAIYFALDIDWLVAQRVTSCNTLQLLILTMPCQKSDDCEYRFTKVTPSLGGIFSVALSVGLRPPGITWHFARWSPDFPL